MFTPEAALVAAAELLANRFGGQPELSDPEMLAGSGDAFVVRARVAHNPFLQERSIIIKQLPPEATQGPDPALIREIVAYQFTNTLATDARPGPTLLAYDIHERLLVTTDAGSADNLVDTWTAADDQTRTGLARRLGTALGRMHRATAGGEENFETLLHRMMAKSKAGGELFAARDRVLVEAIDQGLDMVADLGVNIPDVVADFAADSARRLASGQHRSFTPFDLSPDNILVSREDVIFLDYEWAGFRDVTFDVACVIAGFPQAPEGQALTPELTDIFVTAWAGQVCDIWPNMTNTERLTARLVTAMIGWSLLSLVILRAGGFNALIDGVDGEDALPDLIARPAQDLAQSAAHRDVIETFGALAALTRRAEDPRFPAVEAFARDVVDKISALDRKG